MPCRGVRFWGVSTHSHPKVAARQSCFLNSTSKRFNTQPPEGGCMVYMLLNRKDLQFQHTATRRWLPHPHGAWIWQSQGFNTQPPEGGCPILCCSRPKIMGFQHTATRRWLQRHRQEHRPAPFVSTHSHPKVAALYSLHLLLLGCVSTHSHPKVAASARLVGAGAHRGFNTQPPEGGCTGGADLYRCRAVSTHSHPKVAATRSKPASAFMPFQHTATRRWLPAKRGGNGG